MSAARRLLPSPPARLLPAERLHVPTVAVVAIMTFAIILVAAAGLALANAAGRVSSGTESRFVIQLPSNVASRLPQATAAAKAAPGVIGVTAIPASEMRRTLEDWLGEGASSPDLPVPALATVELARGASAAEVAGRVRAAVPEATLTAQSAELEPLLKSLRILQRLAVLLVLLMAIAAAAAIILATRGALDTHRPTVEIMHGIGATDRQVARLFERKIALDAIAGAAAALLAAALLFVLIGGGITVAGGQLTGAVPLDATDFAILALIAVLAVSLAVFVAHRTLLGALRSSL